MYYKSLKGYSSIGYRVSAERQSVNISSEIIYDQNTFQERDLSQARKRILIVSPYATMRRVHWLEPIFRKAIESRVEITVITRPTDSFQGRSKDAAKIAIEYLAGMGVMTRCRDSLHQKYAVIDEQLVWYGSINLLSFGSSQESIMRLASGSVARALSKSCAHLRRRDVF